MARSKGYAFAIDWVVSNDDTEWLPTEGRPADPPSVTACLVADLFGKTDAEVQADLLKRRAHLYPATFGGR